MFIRFLIVFSLILGNGFLQVKAQDENISQPIPGQFIVKFKDQKGNASEKANELEKKHGSMTDNVLENAFKGAVVKVPPGKEKDIANDPDVEQLVQDFTVYAVGKPDDEFGANGSVMGGASMSGAPPQVIPTGINWIDAELNTTNEGLGVTVAVLDTEIDFKHSDLMVNTSLSRDFSGDNTGGMITIKALVGTEHIVQV